MPSLVHNFLVQLLTRGSFARNASVAAAEIALATEECRSDPVALQIEVTSRCNFKCSYCIVHNGSEPARPADMKIATYRRVLDRFPGAFALLLHGQGEPLLNPKLPEMVRIAEREQRFTSIVTNGSLWIERRTSELLEAGVDVVAFSLDLLPDAEMRAHRVGLDLERVLANLERTLALRDRLRPPTAIGVSAVLLRRVYEDQATLERLVRRMDDLGIDFLMVGPLAGTAAYRTRYPDSLGDERIREPRPHRLLPFRTRCAVYETPETNFFANRCVWPWAAMYVNHDGSVAYCANNHRVRVCGLGEPDARNHPVFRAVRADFRAGRVPAGCEGCQYLLAYRPRAGGAESDDAAPP